MPYELTKSGTSLKIADTTTGAVRFMALGSLMVSTSTTLPSPEIRTNLITIIAGASSVRMGMAEISKIDGVNPAATLADVAAQIMAIQATYMQSVSIGNAVAEIEFKNDSGNPIPSLPQMANGGHLALATHATTGTTYVAFGSQACKQLTIANNSGVDVEVLQGNTGVSFPVFMNTVYTFFGLTNASQLSVRRVDTANTSVTVKARWES